METYLYMAAGGAATTIGGLILTLLYHFLCWLFKGNPLLKEVLSRIEGPPVTEFNADHIRRREWGPVKLKLNCGDLSELEIYGVNSYNSFSRRERKKIAQKAFREIEKVDKQRAQAVRVELLEKLTAKVG